MAVVLVALVCGGGGLAVAASASFVHVAGVAQGLRFVVEPANVVAGQHITGTAGDSAGPAVSVEVLDSSGAIVTSPAVTVTMAIGANPGGATLGGTTSVTTVGGVATFTNLSLDKPGNGYTLKASSLRLRPETSHPFDVTSKSELCQQDMICQTQLDTPASDFQVTANPDPTMSNSGTLTVSLNVGTALQCTGYTPQDINWWEFMMSSLSRSKTIVYTIKMPHLTSTPTATVNDTQACFGAQSVFTTRFGVPATPGPLPDGTSGYIGLLPNCPASGPCIVSRQSVPDLANGVGFDIVVTLSIPESLTGDPWSRL